MITIHKNYITKGSSGQAVGEHICKYSHDTVMNNPKFYKILLKKGGFWFTIYNKHGTAAKKKAFPVIPADETGIINFKKS